MLCSSHAWVRCSPSRLPLDTATRGGFGAVNSAGKEEAWDCRETLLPRAEVPLTLPRALSCRPGWFSGRCRRPGTCCSSA